MNGTSDFDDFDASVRKFCYSNWTTVSSSNWCTATGIRGGERVERERMRKVGMGRNVGKKQKRRKRQINKEAHANIATEMCRNNTEMI